VFVETKTQPLEIRDLSRSFGARKTLDAVSLDLRPNEMLALLGPNGAGKTTLVRTIVGRVVPDSGYVRVHDRDASDPAVRGLIGYVPQDIALYPQLTAAENLAAFGKFNGLRGAALKSAVEQSLQWTGLADRRNDRTATLSGGMKRRLNIAAGTIHRPSIVLLDEPTVGVDPQSRERIYQMIGELRSHGVALLYTSHYMEEVERLCDRIAIIDHGRIIAAGSTAQLVRDVLGNATVTTIETAAPVGAELIERLQARSLSPTRLQVVHDDATGVQALLDLFQRANVTITGISSQLPGLEAVFLQLTGKELRET
jgi:ABC-2 type transport system ATP-binding protein